MKDGVAHIQQIRGSRNLPRSRRQFIKNSATFVSAAAGVLAFGRGAAANDVESILTLMGWAEYISPNNIARWEDMTGSTLIYDAYASNDEMYSKLQLSGGNSGYDLGMNTDFMMPLLINGGYLEKIDRSLVPNFSNLRPEVAGPDFDPENAYSVPKSWGSQGFVYDKSVVTGPMNTWGDFLRAARNEASGRMILLDDPLALAPLFWEKGESWNTTNEAMLMDVDAAVEDLGRHITSFNSWPVQDVATGTVVLAQIWNGTARQAINSSENENLVFVYPEPMSEYWFDSYHMPVGGEHPNAAHSWMNFVLDPEVAAEEIIYTGYLSPVTGVEAYLPEHVANDPLIFPPPEVIARGEPTLRNETYERRIGILTKLKAAAAQ